MPILVAPTSLRLLRAGPRKDGGWINVLQWEASSDSDVSYMIKRRYGHAPMEFGDGQTLAFVSGNCFADSSSEVGRPTFYAVYPRIGKYVGHEGRSVYAGIRPGDVLNLKASRNGPSEVELMWELPFNAVDCTVRKAHDLARINRFSGPTLDVADIHSGTIDRDASLKDHYVVFCTFYDPIKSAYVYSTGLRIHALPYS